MIVQVLLFAQARDIAGQPSLKLDLPAIANIAAVKKALLVSCPDLEQLLPYCLFSVDQRYVDDEEVVTEKSEIGCIPPVSGG